MVDARPATVNLSLYAGDDFALTITVTKADGSAADLTGQTARADIRASAGTSVLASFVASIAANVVALTLPGSVTATLPDAAVWDCQIAGTAGTVTLLAGQVRTSGQVTV